MSFAECPICQAVVAQDVLAVHVESHFIDEIAPRQVASTSAPDYVDLSSPPRSCNLLDETDFGDSIICPYGCNQLILLQDLESHELAHSLADQDSALLSEQAAQQQNNEQEEFDKLQAKYGYTNNVQRPGKCHTCSEAGHWTRDCPKNPNSFVNRVQAPLSTDPSALTLAQRREQYHVVQGGLIPLLAACLGNQPPHMGSVSFLAGHVDPICGSLMDSGWGCGYRNIQMMASHLLRRHPQFRKALFGSCGFVPDIGSLQAWIEAAWRDGFDRIGAEQFGHALQGSRKWIGTTEAATLFAYFHLQPRIIDFMGGTHPSSAGGIARAPTTNSTPLQDMFGDPSSNPSTSSSTSSQQSPAMFNHRSQPMFDQSMVDHQPQSTFDHSMEDQGPQSTVNQSMVASGNRNRSSPAGTIPALWSNIDQQGREKHDQCKSNGQSDEGNNHSGGNSSKFHAIGAGDGTGNGQREGVGSRWRGRGRGGTTERGRGRGSVGGRGSEGSGGSGSHGALVKWVWEYFSNENATMEELSNLSGGLPNPGPPQLQERVRISSRAPLYFQHEGHSRTIIGIECLVRNGQPDHYNLLVLDPGTRVYTLEQALRSRSQWQKLVKRGVHTLTKPQYQIMCIEDGLTSQQTRQQYKVVQAYCKYT